MQDWRYRSLAAKPSHELKNPTTFFILRVTKNLLDFFLLSLSVRVVYLNWRKEYAPYRVAWTGIAMKGKTHHHNANGYASESSSSTSPSPPPSPRRSFNHSRRRLRSKSHSTLAGGILFRRKLRYMLVLPLLYVSGLLMCVGPFSALVGQPAPPGSVYRSHETFQRLWPDIQFDNSTAIEVCFVGFSTFSVLSSFVFGFLENVKKNRSPEKRYEKERWLQ